MTLHIYGQEMWHDDAYIAGTESELKGLLEAIQYALKDGDGSATAFVNDGEGYTIYVVQTTEEQADKMPVPYTDECARSKDEEVQFGPWKLLNISKT